MKLTHYKNREFYTGIYRQGNRPTVEKCDNGHWKEVGKKCEMCQDKTIVNSANK